MDVDTNNNVSDNDESRTSAQKDRPAGAGKKKTVSEIYTKVGVL
jgi:hypothetical protein